MDDIAGGTVMMRTFSSEYRCYDRPLMDELPENPWRPPIQYDAGKADGSACVQVIDCEGHVELAFVHNGYWYASSRHQWVAFRYMPCKPAPHSMANKKDSKNG